MGSTNSKLGDEVEGLATELGSLAASLKIPSQYLNAFVRLLNWTAGCLGMMRNLGRDFLAIAQHASDGLLKSMKKVIRDYDRVVNIAADVHSKMAVRVENLDGLLDRYVAMSQITEKDEASLREYLESLPAKEWSDQCQLLIKECRELREAISDVQLEHAPALATLKDKYEKSCMILTAGGILSVLLGAGTLLSLYFAPVAGPIVIALAPVLTGALFFTTTETINQVIAVMDMSSLKDGLEKVDERLELLQKRTLDIELKGLDLKKYVAQIFDYSAGSIGKPQVLQLSERAKQLRTALDSFHNQVTKMQGPD